MPGLTRQLELLAGEVGGSLLVLKMNVEENFQIPSELDITSLPALRCIRTGISTGTSAGSARKRKSSNNFSRWKGRSRGLQVRPSC